MTQNSDLTFYQASHEDIPYLTEKTLALHEFETQDSHNPLLTSDNFNIEVSDWLKLELSNPSSLLLIISRNESPIGFAFIKILPMQNNFTHYEKFGLIQSIFIDSGFRNKSYGKEVVSFIESIFKEQNIPYYEVNFESSNKIAHEFWSKCGLQPSSITARKFLT